jgi:hypothetical protein
MKVKFLDGKNVIHLLKFAVHPRLSFDKIEPVGEK